MCACVRACVCVRAYVRVCVLHDIQYYTVFKIMRWIIKLWLLRTDGTYNRYIYIYIYIIQWRRKHMKRGEAMNGVCCVALANAHKCKQNGT